MARPCGFVRPPDVTPHRPADARSTPKQRMLKSTSLRSWTPPLDVHATRTRARVVAGPVTVHVYDPVCAPLLATDVAIVDQVAPAFRLTWMSTRPMVPRLCSQRIVCV